MNRPCPDCPPDYCHAYNSHENKHVMSFLYPHDHSGLPNEWANYYFYCTRCLSPLVQINGEWVAPTNIIEWP